MATLQELAPHSKTWIYQSNRELTDKEAAELKAAAQNFASQWKSHGVPVNAIGDVLYNRFIVFVVDDTAENVGGCSIDSSYRFVREAENHFNIQLFDRLNIAYRDGEGNIKVIHRNEIEQALQSGKLTEDSIIFNNLVATKTEFEQNWETPLRNTWVAGLV